MVAAFVFWLVLGVALFLPAIPGRIAKDKGHSFIQWYASGLFFFPMALWMAIKLPPAARDRTGEPLRVRCPHCAELVVLGASLCPFCRSELVKDDGRVLEPVEPPTSEEQAAWDTFADSVRDDDG